MKHLIIILASVLLFMPSAFAGTAGNVNNDTTVDLKDVIATLQVCAGLTPEGVSTAGDANNDGKIGLEEAIYVLQVVAQLRDSNTGSDFSNSLGMTFKLIPAGTFMMGSPATEPGRSSAETQHEVTLTKAFYMQTTEVTQGQWKAVMGSNPSRFTACGDNCPVEQVLWNDAQSFITAMNSRGEGSYRLPTEAEWEYAARAGSTTAFPDGGITNVGCTPVDPNLNAIGWYCGNSGNKTHPVQGKQANAWGLYGMAGNVWEWCQDWYGTYPTGAVTDPTGPGNGSARVIRGGSWGEGAQSCRSASRTDYPPYISSFIIGFRLVRNP